ncbi:MAG: helix-turn-helix transcriptional regulator [Ruminococcus sp.]|nr:helix-turn-helix transcriptional regulator [Ruminococcus sp.]
MENGKVMNAEKTGQFICQLRKEKHMTQTALAEQLNLSNRTVSKWENGDGLPDISVLPQLADALGVTVDELLRGKRNSRPAAVTVTEVADRENISNIYRILSAIALFFAVFAALLGTLTEIYSIYAFRILFYTHWEILFAAISLGASVVAGALYAVGVIRLSLVYDKAECSRLTYRRTWLLVLILLPFPLSFLMRVICVFLPVSYQWLVLTTLLIITAAILFIIHRLTKKKIDL